MLNFISFFISKRTDSADGIALRGWRVRILEGILRGVFILWLFALAGGISNVLEAYRSEPYLYKNPLAMAAFVILVYLGMTFVLAYITFNRKLKLEWRAGLLLFIFYVLGTMGMALSSFSGDGRIFFFAVIILSAVFFDLRYSLTAFILTFFTLALLGWLQVSGTMVVPAERQINSTDAGAWISGGTVLLLLSVAALISVTYLLRVLEQSLAGMRTSLEREQRLSRLLRTLSDVNQLIVRKQDAALMLQQACEILVSDRSYSFSWISLLEPDNLTLKLAASHGATIDPAAFTSRLDQSGSGPSCAMEALRSKRPFFVEPGEKDPCPSCPLLKLYPHRSSLTLPIVREARIFGVLTVVYPSPSGIFDEEETNLLVELADDLAYALEKLESEQRMLIYGRHQKLLNEITHAALEAPDLETMLQSFIEGLEKALSADGYYLTLWDEINQAPERFISSDLFRDILEKKSFLINSGDKIFSQSILNGGRVLAVEDIMTTPYISPHLAAEFPVRSALGLPFIANDHKLGTLALGFLAPHSFTVEEIELAEQAANQIALAILKIRLDIETRARAMELGRLYTAVQDMASSLLDPPALLAKLARHMTDALQVTSGNIMSVNLVESTMQVVGEYWGDEAAQAENKSDLGKVYPTAEYPTITRSMIEGKVLTLHSDDSELTSTEREQFAAYDIKSMMFVPIRAHGQLFGDIELWESRRHREFTPTEIRLAQAMAGHAASIIENSTLFAVTRQRESELGALLRVARAVSSSLQLSDVLKQAATTLTQLLRVDYCSLSDYLPDRNGVVTIAMYSADGDVSKPGDIGHFFSLDEYPATFQVLESGLPMVVRLDDSHADPAEIKYLNHDGMYTSLLIPLRRRGQSLGLVELYSADPNRIFKLEEVQFAGALADQAAVAIENAHLYEKREQQEAYFRALIENSAEGVAILDAEGIVRYIAPSEERLTGYSPAEIYGESAFRFIHPQDAPKVLETFFEGVAIPGAVRTVEYRLQRKDGEWRYFEITGHNMLDDPHVNGIVANYRDVTERKKAEQAVQESQSRLEAVISTAINGIITMDEEQRIVLFNPSAERIFGYSAAEVIGQRHEMLLPQRYQQAHAGYVDEFAVTGKTARRKGMLETLTGLRANGEEFPMEAFISKSEIDGQIFFTIIFQDITERKKAEDAIRESERKFRALAENIPSVVYQCKNDSRYTFTYLNDSIEALTGYPKSAFLNDGLSFVELYHPEDRVLIPIPTPQNEQEINRTSFHITYRIKHRLGNWVWVDEWGTGVLDVQGNNRYLEGVMIDITERKRAEEDLRRHAHELEALAAASAALRTAQSVTEMVPVLAKQALRAVGGNYSSIFLLDPDSGDYVSHGWFSARGESRNQLKDESILRHHPGEGITGHVAMTGEIYVTEDIQEDPVMFMLEDEKKRLQNLHGGISLPLRAQEKIIGVMHIWMIDQHIFGETEIRILIALAETAGNAIHRAILFEQTLQHADELALAYDNTLAGWARALELRDEITEGHTRRVTELTLQLARALHVPESEIVHIRRGALLHDIGKMGIPDSILHKPGAFTMQERIIMEQHTQYAYDMISSISFLQPALDIPFCHHEYWDGNGYPRKLKGEQIPLAARIFTVVDVWDALTSDRPYRMAWSKEKTRSYILERSGKQFDPQVVEVFFSQVINKD